MPTRKKKFIDKKNSVTFKLVHRSQKDPLAADENAPQHVFLDCETLENNKKRKVEQQKYGIYYDDDYNYLQHLKDVNTVSDWEPVMESSHSMERPKLNLPSSVFQSHVEESEGLLNKATVEKGPKPDWDPDIVAALDDDFDFENRDNELEDNFIILANPPEDSYHEYLSPGEGSSDDESSANIGKSDDDSSEHSFGSEEAQTRFTNYSMSSSVLPRNENMQEIDDHFEKFFEKYDDEEIGALDMDDIQGYLKPDNEMVRKLASTLADGQDKMSFKEFVKSSQRLQDTEIVDTSGDEFLDIIVEEKATEKWDCESIISTYSTTNNKPKLIEEPRKTKTIEVSGNSGLPRCTLNMKGLTHRMLKNFEEDSASHSKGKESNSRNSTVSIVRSKNETAIERKERKSTIKQIRRERRSEKKSNKLAFKEEEKHQEKAMLNLKQNLKCIKLL